MANELHMFSSQTYPTRDACLNFKAQSVYFFSSTSDRLSRFFSIRPYVRRQSLELCEFEKMFDTVCKQVQCQNTLVKSIFSLKLHVHSYPSFLFPIQEKSCLTNNSAPKGYAMMSHLNFARHRDLVILLSKRMRQNCCEWLNQLCCQRNEK